MVTLLLKLTNDLSSALLTKVFSPLYVVLEVFVVHTGFTLLEGCSEVTHLEGREAEGVGLEVGHPAASVLVHGTVVGL